MLVNQSAAFEQFKALDFGDQRLNDRVMKVHNTFSEANMQESYPTIFKDVHQLKGFYRLMNNDKVSLEKFQEGSRKGLINYLTNSGLIFEKSEGDKEYVYLMQDTSYVKYHQRKVELGYFNTLKDNGVILHSSTLFDKNFIPVGILQQDVIIRDKENFKSRSNDTSRDFEEKESYKWAAALDAAKELSNAHPIYPVHVGDAEADNSDYFNKVAGDEQYYLVRSKQDRALVSEEGKLRNYLMNSPLSHTEIRRVRNRSGKIVKVPCQIRYRACKIRHIDHKVWVGYLKVMDSTEDVEETEWFILTNLPLSEQERRDSLVFNIYEKRWTSCEDYYKVLKTGLGLEKRQWQSPKAIVNHLCFLSIQAVELLRIRHFSQEEPDRNWGIHLTDEEQALADILCGKHLKKRDFDFAKPQTNFAFLLLLGALGGHQGISRKGRPGWQTLTKGYQYFQQLLKGVQLAKQMNLANPP